MIPDALLEVFYQRRKRRWRMLFHNYNYAIREAAKDKRPTIASYVHLERRHRKYTFERGTNGNFLDVCDRNGNKLDYKRGDIP